MREPAAIEAAYSKYFPPRPSAGAIARHAGLLCITIATATIAGVLFPFGPEQDLPSADPQSLAEVAQFFGSLPAKYAELIGHTVYTLLTNADYLRYGLSFSLSLLFILFCHEMGHYVACRLYKVDATLPFFIPTPPMIGPAGTFGAFIKIRSPMPSRHAVFDIGVAGPIAGFIALIPVAIVGVLTMQPATPAQLASSGGIVFNDPLFMRLLGSMSGHDPSVSVGNPFYYAAWVGLLVTALNLIPSGQLDGGHAIYAALGERVHYWAGRIAFALMAIFSVLGIYYYSSPSGLLITIILGIMLRVGHPRPYDQTPLDTKRRLIAVLTLVIFVLCFVPFPIQIS